MIPICSPRFPRLEILAVALWLQWSIATQVPGQTPPLPRGAVWQFQPGQDSQAGIVNQVRFAASGSLLAVWGPGPKIWLLDATKGKVQNQLNSPIPVADVYAAMDRHTVYAVNGGEQSGLVCWNTQSGEQTFDPRFSGILLEPLRDELLMTVDQRGYQVLRVPELTTEFADYFDEPLLPLCIDAANGGIVAVETVAGQIGQRASLKWFETRTRSSRSIATLSGNRAKACLIEEQDGIVAFCEQGVGGVKIVSLDFSQPPHAPVVTPIKLGQAAVTELAVTSDGRFLTTVEQTGTQQGTLHFWELATRDSIAELPIRADRVTSLDVAGSPGNIAVAISDQTGSSVLLFSLLQTLRVLAPESRGERTIDTWIEQLGDASASEAYAAAAWLASHPQQSLPALQRLVESVIVIPNDEDVARWIGELDSPEFRRRRKAWESLRGVRDLVLPQLEAALNAGHSLGTEVSLRQLIHAVPSDANQDARRQDSEKSLAGLRLVSTLQMIASTEANALLAKLRAGHPIARVRRVATDATVISR